MTLLAEAPTREETYPLQLPPMQLDAADLAARLDACMTADRYRLGRRLRANDPNVATEIDRSVKRREARLHALPKPRYPMELPVVQKRDDIAAAIAANQV